MNVFTRGYRGRLAHLALVALALSLSGCSMEDFGSPGASVTDIVDSGKPFVDRGEDERAAARALRLNQAVEQWQRQRATEEDADFRLGPDDVLEIGVFALEQPNTMARLTRTIGRDGLIQLPLAGNVSVAGLSVRDATERINAAYANRYLKNPQVTVSVADYKSAPVVLTGAVKNPGVYFLRHNSVTVLETLSLAQGLSPQAGDTLLIVRAAPEGSTPPQAEAGATMPAPASTNLLSGTSTNQPADIAQQVIPVDLKQLLDEGDLRLNLRIHKGDFVSVPPRKAQYFYVLGYVRRPGAFEITADRRIQALQAVAMAGGLSAAARAENSFVIIENEKGRKVVPVDLTKIARGVRPPLYLEPGDTLVIGSSALAKVAEFIKFGASASVSPGP